jgi:hypothetical protein
MMNGGYQHLAQHSAFGTKEWGFNVANTSGGTINSWRKNLL